LEKITKALTCLVIFLASYGATSQVSHAKVVKALPRGFFIRDSVFADLDGDGRQEAVVVLAKKPETHDLCAVRPVLLLRSTGKKWKTALRNDSIVLCLATGKPGTDPFSAVVISDNNVTFAHMAGSGDWVYTQNITFTFLADKKALMLTGDEGVMYRRNDPTRVLPVKGEVSGQSMQTYRNPYLRSR
jgi:hypothetical protein